MKKTIARIAAGIALSFAIAGIVVGCASATARTETYYPQAFIVTSATIPYDGVQTLTIQTVTGYSYEFDSDAGDWSPGDLCACVMSTNGTPSIVDDIVVEARYSGIAEWYVNIYPNA